MKYVLTEEFQRNFKRSIEEAYEQHFKFKEKWLKQRVCSIVEQMLLAGDFEVISTCDLEGGEEKWGICYIPYREATRLQAENNKLKEQIKQLKEKYGEEDIPSGC